MLYGKVFFEFIAEADFKSASAAKKWFMSNHTFETKENGAEYPVYEVNFTPKKENKHYRIRATLHLVENDIPANTVNNDIKDFIHSINIDNYRHKTNVQVHLVQGSIDFSKTSSKNKTEKILASSSSPLSMELVGKRCPKGYTKNRKTGRCNKTKKNKASPVKKQEMVVYVGHKRIVL